MVRALATTPDARTALVAVFGHGVTTWRLPAGELAFGLVPVPGADEHADHVHPVDAMAVGPGAGEVAVTVRGQLLRYALATGDLVAELPGSPLRFRALAWSADSSRLLVSAFYDGAVHLLRSGDGAEVGRLDAGRALTAFALSPDGRLAALATELGPISLFEVASGRAAATLPGAVPAQALAFAGSHLVAARQDGALEVWRVADARRLATTPAGPTVVTLAAAPDGAVVATGGLDGTVRLHGIPGGDLRETLRWHPHPVQALAWAGPLLLAGDTGGGLAIWDVGPGTATENPGRRRAPEGTVAP
jgi:WD40 repeat protein